jgi:hypothetical protein
VYHTPRPGHCLFFTMSTKLHGNRKRWLWYVYLHWNLLPSTGQVYTQVLVMYHAITRVGGGSHTRRVLLCSRDPHTKKKILTRTSLSLGCGLCHTYSTLFYELTILCYRRVFCHKGIDLVDVGLYLRREFHGHFSLVLYTNTRFALTTPRFFIFFCSVPFSCVRVLLLTVSVGTSDEKPENSGVQIARTRTLSKWDKQLSHMHTYEESLECYICWMLVMLTSYSGFIFQEWASTENSLRQVNLPNHLQFIQWVFYSFTI